MRQALKDEGFTSSELASLDNALRHAEGEAVHRLRTTSTRKGLVDINQNYICMHCMLHLRYLIPEGKSLTVRFRTGGGREISVRFKRGSDPELLVGDSWKRLDSRYVTAKNLEAILAEL
jgi:hypothetical protein